MSENIRVVIEGDASDLRAALAGAAADLRGFGAVASTEGRRMTALNTVLEQQQRNVAALARTMRYAAIGLGGLGGYAAVQAIKKGIELNASWESAAAGIATFTGSVKSAEKFIERLRKVSAESPLRLTDYEEAARQLMGFGVEVDKVIPLLDAVNKAVVATGGGSEDMMQVVTALGQIQARGKASAEELNQLATIGVPVNKILQKELGLTGDQVSNIGEESIKADKVLGAIADGWNKRYADAYKNAQDTFAFQSARLQKQVEQLLRVSTEPLFAELRDKWVPALNDAATEIIKIWERPGLTPGEKFERSFKTLERELGPLIDDLGDTISDLHLDEKFADVLDTLIPLAAEGFAKLALTAAESFAGAFIHADVWTKLVMGSWLFTKIAGGQGWILLGKKAAEMFGRGFGKTAPSTVPTGAPSGGGGKGTPFIAPLGGAALATVAGAYRKELIDTIFPDGWANEALHNAFDSSSITTSGGTGGFFGDGLVSQITKTWQGIFGDGASAEAKGRVQALLDEISDGNRVAAYEMLQDWDAAGNRLTEKMIWQWQRRGRIDAKGASDLISTLHTLQDNTRDAYAKMLKAQERAGDGVRGFTKSAGGWLKDFASKGSANIRGLANSLEDDLNKALDKSGGAVKSFSNKAADAVDDFAKKGDKSNRFFTTSTENMVNATGRGIGTLGRNLEGALKELGLKKAVSFSIETVGNTAKGVARARGGLAGGGMVRVPGTGLEDKVPLIANGGLNVVAPGEDVIVANRHQRPMLDAAVASAFGVDGLRGFFSRFDKPHYMAKGGMAAMIAEANRFEAHHFPYRQRGGEIFHVPGVGSGDKVPAMLEPGEVVINREAVKALGGARHVNRINDLLPRFASGGWVDPAGPGHGVVNPAIAGVVGRWSQRYNAAINYGYDPGGGHVSPGHNVTGTATDTGPAAGWGAGPTQLFEQGLRTLVNAGLTVLYGSHGVGTPYPNHGYGNHAHIEWGMHPSIRGLGSAAAAEMIKRVLLKGPDGPLKAMGQASLDKVHKAANAFLARHSGGFTGGDVGKPIRSLPDALQKYNRTYPRSSGFGDGYSLPFDVVAALAEWSGTPGVSMARTAIGESQLEPGAVGHDPGGSIGWGLQMITTGVGNDAMINALGGGPQMLNPVKNEMAAKKIWDSAGWGAWYSRTKDTSNTHYRGPLLRQLGGIIPHLAGGGTLHGSVSGGHTDPAWRRLEKARDISQQLKELLGNKGRIARITERISVAERLAALDSSPMGSELSSDERARQIALNERLLAGLIFARKQARAGIRQTMLDGLPADKQTKKKLGDLRAGFNQTLRDLVGVTGKGGSIFETKLHLDELKNIPPTANEEEISSLLREELNQARLTAALSEAQFGTFSGFFNEYRAQMPFVGPYAHGTWPRTVGRTGFARVHRDETILPDPQGPFMNVAAQQGGRPTEIKVYIEGDTAPLMRKVRAEVDGRAVKVVNRQLGRSSRQLSVAPGG